MAAIVREQDGVRYTARCSRCGVWFPAAVAAWMQRGHERACFGFAFNAPWPPTPRENHRVA